MEDDSTTAAADDQTDSGKTDDQTDPNATTDQQTPKTGDDLDTSKSTDESADGDKKPEEGKTEDETPAPKFDSDLDDWAEKTGRKKPETDEDRALLQEIRDDKRNFSKGQEEKQAKKSADDLNKGIKDVKPDVKSDDDDDRDPLEKRLDDSEARFEAERTARLQSEYFQENSVTEEESKAMQDFLKETIDTAESDDEKLEAFKYWTNPKRLGQWHKMAKANLASDPADTTALQDEAARKERVRIEREHQANGSSRSASTTTTSGKTEADKRLERFSKWDD